MLLYAHHGLLIQFRQTAKLYDFWFIMTEQNKTKQQQKRKI